MQKSSLIAYSKVVFTVSVWGASFIVTKIAINNHLSPATIVWLRFSIGVLILASAVFQRKQFGKISLKEIFYFALLGFIGITFHQWLQSNGLVTAQASTTAWIVASTPIFIAALGLIILKEKLGVMKIMGIMIAAFGVLLVATHGNLQIIFEGRLSTRGDFLVLLSAPNWAVFSVLSRKGLKSHPPARMMFYVMLFGWIFSTMHFFSSGNTSELKNISVEGWTALLFLGIFCSGFAYIFWYDALKVLKVADLGVFLYIEPLIAVVTASILLSEKMNLYMWLGGIAILLGVWIVERNKQQRQG